MKTCRPPLREWQTRLRPPLRKGKSRRRPLLRAGKVRGSSDAAMVEVMCCPEIPPTRKASWISWCVVVWAQDQEACKEGKEKGSAAMSGTQA